MSELIERRVTSSSAAHPGDTTPDPIKSRASAGSQRRTAARQIQRSLHAWRSPEAGADEAAANATDPSGQDLEAKGADTESGAEGASDDTDGAKADSSSNGEGEAKSADSAGGGEATAADSEGVDKGSGDDSATSEEPTPVATKRVDVAAKLKSLSRKVFLAPKSGTASSSKIYLGGRQAAPKPPQRLPAVDPKVRLEMEVIKAAIEQDAAKVKGLWSVLAVPVGLALSAAGKGAAIGLGAGPIGAAIGAAAGVVVGALLSIFGIGGAKHKVMEQKAELLSKIDLLVHQPDVIRELYDYCVVLGPSLKVIDAKADAALEELSNNKKKLAEKDKKAQDKKAGPKAAGHSTAEKLGHAGHTAHNAVEKVSAGAAGGAAAAEAGAHGLSEAAAKVCEVAAPMLESVAHVAHAAGPAVGLFVVGCDYKSFSEKAKKFKEAKEKVDAAGGPP